MSSTNFDEPYIYYLYNKAVAINADELQFNNMDEYVMYFDETFWIDEKIRNIFSKCSTCLSDDDIKYLFHIPSQQEVDDLLVELDNFGNTSISEDDCDQNDIFNHDVMIFEKGKKYNDSYYDILDNEITK